jgi:ATP-dependent DNA helicase RecG
MTATPIPRTLAMVAYADLDCSAIPSCPRDVPVQTAVVPETRRPEVIARVRSACVSGRQAQWVCTLVEESDLLRAQAAETPQRSSPNNSGAAPWLSPRAHEESG